MRSGRPSDRTPMLNGAQALIRTLVDAGVTTCFTNPGTSEMHFVSALDTVPQMRAILTLFEGVATGAADGYARMADRPAATLLHLGPGLGNGLANLHNARKGKVPIVNIVGDHATYHAAYDAQLQSDIETVARNVSSWVRTAKTTEDLGRDAVEAVAAATRAAGPGRDTDSPRRCFVGRRGRARRPARTICAFRCDRRGRRGRGDGLAQRQADTPQRRHLRHLRRLAQHRPQMARPLVRHRRSHHPDSGRWAQQRAVACRPQSVQPEAVADAANKSARQGMVTRLCQPPTGGGMPWSGPFFQRGQLLHSFAQPKLTVGLTVANRGSDD